MFCAQIERAIGTDKLSIDLRSEFNLIGVDGRLLRVSGQRPTFDETMLIACVLTLGVLLPSLAISAQNFIFGTSDHKFEKSKTSKPFKIKAKLI